VTFHGLVACCQKRLKWHQVLQLRAAMEQGAIFRGRAPWGVEARTNMKNQWTNGFIMFYCFNEASRLGDLGDRNIFGCFEKHLWDSESAMGRWQMAA